MRHAYTAYDVISVVQEELAPDITLVEWQFLLPQNHPNRLVTYRRASTASLGSFIGKVNYIYSHTCRSSLDTCTLSTRFTKL